MHVLDPKDIANRKVQKSHAKKTRTNSLIFIACLVIFAAGTGSWYALRNAQPVAKSNTPEPAKQQANQSPPPVAKTKTKLKTFTPVEFRDLYRATNYPNTANFTTPPEITGNLQADARIRSLAEKRGFALTSIPVAPIEKSGEQLTGAYQDDLLQPLAFKSWQQLKNAAKTDKVAMSLLSAYRSPKSQRDLFTDRLYSTGITPRQIAAGIADDTVNETLSLTAVPGYSRHHTGYTIDLYCDDGVAFGSSECNDWITKDNYANAKKFGWIPSYPPGAGEQGPEPEAWEYVWVGTDSLYE